MKIIIAGGNGYLGSLLINHFKKENQIFVLTRNHKLNEKNVYYLKWDGKSKAYWVSLLNNSDVFINLTGKSVNCRYTQENKNKIYSSRLDSTALLCEVVQGLSHPPKVFIQSSSATIYKHSYDKLMTEHSGEIGVDFSMDVCKKWEQTFNSYHLKNTTKIITRTAIVLGNNGGAFPIIKKLAKLGLGGKQGKGNQYISWITEKDYVRALVFLIKQKSGTYNICAPNPIRNRDFQKIIRKKLNILFGLPSPVWLLKIGALFIRTEPELILKSRNVFPEKLINLGFVFNVDNFNNYKI